MFKIPRKLLVIFLVMLQLIAPLVHAHTGEKVSGLAGFHVPGLEMYSVEHDACMSQAVSVDFSPDGIIVGVNAGIKDKQVYLLTDNDNCYNPHQIPAFNTAHILFNVNLSPQPAQLLCRLFILSPSPRAPPTQ